MNQEDDRVSLWVGRVGSDDALQDYLNIEYDEDGDSIPSKFQKAFEISYYDEDFREAQYLGDLTDDLATALEGCSYDSEVIPKFVSMLGPSNLEPFDAVLLLYNFEYSGQLVQAETPPVRIRFLGTIKIKRPRPAMV